MYDKGRYWHGAAFTCVQCLVACEQLISWTFPGLHGKNVSRHWVSSRYEFLVIYSLIISFLLYSGRGEMAVCHSWLWHFISESYEKIYVSSPVITLFKKFSLFCMHSQWSKHILFQFSFCSNMRFFWSILEYNFRMFNFWVEIWCTLKRFKFNLLLIIYTYLNVSRRSHCTRFLTYSTFLSAFELSSRVNRGRGGFNPVYIKYLNYDIYYVSGKFKN